MPRTSQTHKTPVKSVPVPVKSFHPPTSLPIAPAPTSFGQIIKEGVGFGIGQSIAHRAVAAVLGPPVAQTIITPPPSETKASCVSERVAFETCMKTNNSQDHCNNEMLSYKQCIELH